jgi:AbrB family looped-hinge helix DNA binding protein
MLHDLQGKPIRRTCKKMDTLATISAKYQLVIPRAVREQFNLKPGQKVMFIPYRNSIRLVIVPEIEDALGILAGVDISPDELSEEVDEERG